MANLYIVTVATESKFYFPYLIKSCKNNGVQLKILAYGEKWKGFNWRFKLVLDYLKSLNGNDIVCFVDGYDVICTRNLKTLPNIFLNLKKKHNCKIIIGKHKRISKNNIIAYFNNLMVNYYFSTCNNKALNAGTYIGYAKDLLNILEKIYNLFPINNYDDQILMTKYCKKYSNEIYIDTNNEIFLTLENPYKEIDNYLEFKNNQVYYNNNSPFFIHGAGDTYLDNIIIKLKYDYDNKINNLILKNYYNKLYFRLLNNIWLIFLILIVIILIILFYVYKKFYKKFYKNK